MILDTTNKTVTFKAEETLTTDQIWDILMFLDPLDAEEGNKVPEPMPVPFPLTRPHLIRLVRSDADWRHQYSVVQLLNGRWICSCQDFWQRNKYDLKDTCKHIDRVANGWV